MIFNRRAGMFTHHVEGARTVTGFDSFLDDQVLAVADNDPVQRPADAVAAKHIADAAVRNHLQSALAVLNERVVASLHDCPVKDQVGDGERFDCLVIDDAPANNGSGGFYGFVKTFPIER